LRTAHYLIFRAPVRLLLVGLGIWSEPDAPNKIPESLVGMKRIEGRIHIQKRPEGSSFFIVAVQPFQCLLFVPEPGIRSRSHLLAQHSQCLGNVLLEQQSERRSARWWQVISRRIRSYSLPAFSCWDYFAPDCEWIEARIGSEASRWRSFCSFDELSPRGKLPFIDSLKYRPELQ
jgi:hypothetical protein